MDPDIFQLITKAWRYYIGILLSSNGSLVPVVALSRHSLCSLLNRSSSTPCSLVDGKHSVYTVMERIGEARFDDFSVTFSHWLENEMQYSGPISSDILSR